MNRLSRGVAIVGAVLLTAVLAAGVALANVNDHYPYTAWSPYSGDMHIFESGGARNALNDLNFGPRSGAYFRDGWAGNKNAFEFENWFYDYCDAFGGCAYSKSASNWFTNFPGATDLDNNNSNPAGEVSLEIKALDGDSLQTYTWYYADFNLTANSAWSRVKIRGARAAAGIGCFWWWCTAELDGDIIVPYNNYIAPGPLQYWNNF